MSQEQDKPTAPNEPAQQPVPENQTPEVSVSSHSQSVDDSYGYYEDPYAYESNTVPVAQEQPASPPPPPPAAPSSQDEPEDPDEDGMLRMSFLEHLEELRTRIIQCLVGLGVSFLLSLTFSNQLWRIVSAPAVDALTQLGIKPPKLVSTDPLEQFQIVWVKMPLLTAIFLASPWVMWQIWSFIAPGLYKKERRWAAPFVIVSAALFITGGLFAYYVAFRYGLVFLLGIGRDIDIQPMVSITSYFDLFVNVTLGIGLVFELPVIIFFLTLLRVASPRWLLENSRYAILGIVVVAAIITPTPDIFNLLIFAVPMVGLFFIGVFASYLLVLSREGKSFPWSKVLIALAVLLVLAAAAVYLAITRYGYHLVPQWPFLIR
ncbi:MAG: twin-arginine translocase subunit TatC [Bryobacteraceae bacterium]